MGEVGGVKETHQCHKPIIFLKPIQEVLRPEPDQNEIFSPLPTMLICSSMVNYD